MKNAESEYQIFIEMAKERYLNNNIKKWVYDKESDKDFDIKLFKSDYDKFEPKQIFGQRWKKWLCLLGSFCEEYKHITNNFIDHPEHNATILSISCTNSNLKSIFDNGRANYKKHINDIIHKLIEVGGLVVVNDKYRFDYKNSYSKRYAYNKYFEKYILNQVKINKINIIINKCDTNTFNFEKYDDFKFDVTKWYKVACNSKLKVAHITDEEAISILNKKYEILLKDGIKKINELNKVLPNERKIKFQWHLNFSKTGFLTKASIRATNKLVSLKEHENENPNYTGKWRRDLLKETGFDKDEFDVHGSIYQISHLLNTGDPITNEIDPYRKMFGDMSDEDRTYIKSMAMPLYFDRKNCILNHNRHRIPQTFKNYGKDGINPVIYDYSDLMFKYTGKSLDSEIFLHESLIYIDFVYELYKSGIDCIQIYDGFYFNKRIDKDYINNLLKSISIKYYNKYKQYTLGNTSFIKEDIKDKQYTNINNNNKINNNTYISLGNTSFIKEDIKDKNKDINDIIDDKDNIKIKILEEIDNQVKKYNISCKQADKFRIKLGEGSIYTKYSHVYQRNGFSITSDSIKITDFLTNYINKFIKIKA